MSENRKYTAFCGLYCKDCIPSNHGLFDLAGRLANILDELGFEHYAKLKSARIKELEHYDAFRKLLTAMKKLQCETSCFEGPVSECGCNKDCEMRRCVIEKGLTGCWECTAYKTCEKLAWHKEFHPGMEHNLDMIRQYGIENWLDKKGKHYRWNP
jgi:hypothetical protein